MKTKKKKLSAPLERYLKKNLAKYVREGKNDDWLKSYEKKFRDCN